MLGLSLLALFLLVGGLPSVRFQPGQPINLLDWFLAQLDSQDIADSLSLPGQITSDDLLTNTGDQILSLVIISFWVILIASIVYAIVSPQFRRELLRMLMLVLVILWVFPLIANNITENQNRDQAPEFGGEFQLSEPPLPSPPAYLQDPPVGVLFGQPFTARRAFWWCICALEAVSPKIRIPCRGRHRGAQSNI